VEMYSFNDQESADSEFQYKLGLKGERHAGMAIIGLRFA
jgi:hypothetical protein